MNILIADDYLENRRFLYDLLLPFGSCDQAANGLEAVDLVEASLVEEIPYNLILLDIMMPVMDGQSALHAIRALEVEYGVAGAREAVIIMVTALDAPEAVTEAFYKGYCTDYIIKPFTRRVLLDKLKEYNLIPRDGPGGEKG
ncbi:MAG: response regulator [Magnetococcales bacterium]|nr:response regulator [Magnetococcales bacterium]